MTTNPTTKVIEFDANLASAWLATCRFEHQRKPSRIVVDYYAREMNNGKFKTHTVLEVSVLGNERYLVDGQHRLLAVQKANVRIPFVVLEQPVLSYEEIQERYAYTDRGKRRTTTDQFTALSISEEFGLPSYYTNALGAAVMLIERKFNLGFGMAMSLDEKLAMMRDYAPLMMDFVEIISPVPQEMTAIVKRTHVAALAVITLRYSARICGRKTVEDFWSKVVSDDGLDRYDPRKVANRHLLTTNLQTKGRGSSNTITPQHTSARFLAYCFDRFVVGKEIRKTPTIDATQPFSITGYDLSKS